MPECHCHREEIATLEFPALLRVIGDEEKPGRDEALARVLRFGLDAAFPALEEALRSDEADVRNAAMELLVKFGELSVRRLVPLLRDRDEEVRTFCAVLLGDLASRHAVPALLEALHDEDANVRHAAAEALGRIGDPAAAPALIPLLSEDLWLSYPAIVALGNMRAGMAVPHLVALIGDEMLAAVALEALGQIGDAGALPALWQVAMEGDSATFASAAAAIGAVAASSGAHAVGDTVGGAEIARLEELAAGEAPALSGPARELLAVLRSQR